MQAAKCNGSTPSPVADTSSVIFTKAEVEASVDRQEWIDHLTKNLQSPIEKAARKGMKAGTYTVQVKFLVEKDGSSEGIKNRTKMAAGRNEWQKGSLIPYTTYYVRNSGKIKSI